MWSFTSAPGTYHLLSPMCQSCRTASSPASATHSCQPSLEPRSSWPMGLCSHALLGTNTAERPLSPASLLFPLPPKHSHACQQLEGIRNGKERLMFHLNAAQSLPSPKQLPGSPLPGQCSTAETPWCLADTLLFLYLDLCVF